MNECSGPAHHSDCLAGRISDSLCRCARADWLDEPVPRARARAELLTQLEKWAREQRIFQDSDLHSVRAPAAMDPALIELIGDGSRLVSGVVRATWERMAVRALNMRKECTERLAELENQQPTELGLSIEQHADLSAVVEARQRSCDGTLRAAQQWAQGADVDWPGLRARLADNGGYCDCAVVLNVFGGRSREASG